MAAMHARQRAQRKQVKKKLKSKSGYDSSGEEEESSEEEDKSSAEEGESSSEEPAYDPSTSIAATRSRRSTAKADARAEQLRKIGEESRKRQEENNGYSSDSDSESDEEPSRRRAQQQRKKKVQQEESDYSDSDDSDEGPRRGRMRGKQKKQTKSVPLDRKSSRTSPKTPRTPADYGDEEDSASDDDDRRQASSQPTSDQRHCNCSSLNEIRVTRTDLLRWVEEPYFDSAVKLRFVRFKIGENTSRKGRAPKPIYRICQITAVNREYGFYEFYGKRTNIRLELAFGLNVRRMRMVNVSNQPFTEAEFTVWKREMLKINMMPSMKTIAKERKILLRKAQKFENYSYTEEDYEKLTKLRLQREGVTTTNTAATREELRIKRERARQRGDEKEVQRLSKKIDELHGAAEQARKALLKDVSVLRSINQQAMKKNSDSVMRRGGTQKATNPYYRTELQAISVFRLENSGTSAAKNGNDDSAAASNDEQKKKEVETSETKKKKKKKKKRANYAVLMREAEQTLQQAQAQRRMAQQKEQQQLQKKKAGKAGDDDDGVMTLEQYQAAVRKLHEEEEDEEEA